MLKRMVEGSRYLVVIGVISSLIASLAVFVWGLVKTGVVVLGLLRTGGRTR